jgi:hypothetical protein
MQDGNLRADEASQKKGFYIMSKSKEIHDCTVCTQRDKCPIEKALKKPKKEILNGSRTPEEVPV